MEKKTLIHPLNLTKLRREFLPPRKHNATKWDFGHVLIIGGDYGMAGAARMAGEAALRVGAGLVSIATHPEHAFAISSARPELMAHGITTSNQLEQLLTRATVIVIGPGLGQSSWSKKLFLAALNAKKPMVIDADGLNLLATNIIFKKFIPNKNWILTPHAKEAIRLLQNNKIIDRVATVKTLQKKYGGICLLKGSGTLITDGEEIDICNQGNPGMATGGMGDILSGIIGGLIAQKLPLNTAAKLGVCLHATAGDLAAKDSGERGLLAMDLLPYLQQLVNKI